MLLTIPRRDFDHEVVMDQIAFIRVLEPIFISKILIAIRFALGGRKSVTSVVHFILVDTDSVNRGCSAILVIQRGEHQISDSIVAFVLPWGEQTVLLFMELEPDIVVMPPFLLDGVLRLIGGNKDVFSLRFMKVTVFIVIKETLITVNVVPEVGLIMLT